MTVPGGVTARNAMLAGLHAAKQEMPVLPKDKINPHFRSKYTSLDAIVERVEPVLAKHGLVWFTMPSVNEHGQPALDYRLVCVETGDSITGSMPLMVQKADPQGQGSAITYARRYALCAVLNLVADEDDDGNAATPAKAASPKPKPAPKKEQKGPLLWDTAAHQIVARLRQSGMERSAIELKLVSLGVEDTSSMLRAIESLNKDQREDLMTWVEGEN